MASNVWVRRADGNTFVRGSEITEVRVRTSRVTSYGKEVERDSIIRITLNALEPEETELWRFSTRPAAEKAMRTLLSALSTDPCGVVVREVDETVQVSHFAADSE